MANQRVWEKRIMRKVAADLAGTEADEVLAEGLRVDEESGVLLYDGKRLTPTEAKRVLQARDAVVERLEGVAERVARSIEGEGE